jgi:hypothetical protein
VDLPTEARSTDDDPGIVEPDAPAGKVPELARGIAVPDESVWVAARGRIRAGDPAVGIDGIDDGALAEVLRVAAEQDERVGNALWIAIEADDP